MCAGCLRFDGSVAGMDLRRKERTLEFEILLEVVVRSWETLLVVLEAESMEVGTQSL